MRGAGALTHWSARLEPIAIVTHAGVIKAAGMAEGDGPWEFKPPVDLGGIIKLSDENQAVAGRLVHD